MGSRSHYTMPTTYIDTMNNTKHITEEELNEALEGLQNYLELKYTLRNKLNDLKFLEDTCALLKLACILFGALILGLAGTWFFAVLNGVSDNSGLAYSCAFLTWVAVVCTIGYFVVRHIASKTLDNMSVWAATHIIGVDDLWKAWSDEYLKRVAPTEVSDREEDTL